MGKLKDRLVAMENAIAENRSPELILKREDPIKWEILYSRLSNLVQNARETARLISASPVVREMGECIFALFTPEGDSVAFSTGLQLHVANIGTAIKWMLTNDYEEKVGIKEGDYFLNNDPYIAGTHPPDQITITPIFYGEELIGWAGALNHVVEVGAIEAGGVSMLSQTRFDEGLVMPCVKIAENDEIKHDLEIMVERDVRTAVWWLLDSRARMAGTKIIREEIKKIIRECGFGYYMKAIYEYIEDCKQACLKKQRTLLFPGKYQSVYFLDVCNSKLPVRKPGDYLLKIPVETTVTPEGEVTFDFEGASPAGPFCVNSTKGATIGNIANQLIQTLFYDIKYNQGSVQSWKAIIPYSCLNPESRFYATGMWVTAVLASAGVVECISRAFYEAGYREEVVSSPPTQFSLHVSGTDQYDRPLSLSLFEGGYSGMPASGVLDGLDMGYAFYNTCVDCSDVEVWEKTMPLIYLGRHICRDSGGFGKYRGGNGIEELFGGTQVDKTIISTIGSSTEAFVHKGFMGGYPAPINYRYRIHNTNLEKLVKERKPLPHGIGEEVENPDWAKLNVQGEVYLTNGIIPELEFNKWDLLHMMNNGGGSYGDPIERDPKAVERDVKLDLTSPLSAERVYKVVLNQDTMEVDYSETENLRQKYREERKKKGIPAEEYINEGREKILSGEIPPISRQCLNASLKISDRFRMDFIRFWGLAEDFKEIK